MAAQRVSERDGGEWVKLDKRVEWFKGGRVKGLKGGKVVGWGGKERC
jgi:hypothetical protein